MKQVVVVCEGQTEELFVWYLGQALEGVYLRPQMIETSPAHRGGALEYERVKRHITNTLRDGKVFAVTTLFDVYKLRPNFPAHAQAQQQATLEGKLELLKQAFHADIVQHTNCRPERFIPYFQPDEFEALVFSDVKTLTAHQANWSHWTDALEAVVQNAESPEHIPHPAGELEQLRPKYKKVLNGSAVVQDIGLDTVVAKCKFFAGWVQQLQHLAVT